MMMSVVNQKRKLDDSGIGLIGSSCNNIISDDGMMMMMLNSSLDDGDIAWEECQRMIESMTLQIQNKNKNSSNMNTKVENINNDTKHVQDLLQSISLMEQQIDNVYHTNVQKESIVIKQKLQEKIIYEQEQIQQQEQYIEQLQCQYTNIIQEKQLNEHILQQLVQEQQQLQNTISTYKNQVSTELNEMEQIQDICKQKVPRLRQQLSLYGNVTGIKWNFQNNSTSTSTDNEQQQQEQNLIGQVNVPSIKTIKQFHINPNDYSRYEIANMLWNLMENTTTTGTSE